MQLQGAFISIIGSCPYLKKNIWLQILFIIPRHWESVWGTCTKFTSVNHETGGTGHYGSSSIAPLEQLANSLSAIHALFRHCWVFLFQNISKCSLKSFLLGLVISNFLFQGLSSVPPTQSGSGNNLELDRNSHLPVLRWTLLYTRLGSLVSGRPSPMQIHQ